MKFTLIGILCLHALQINGNYLTHANNSSSLQSTRRLTRSLGSTKKDFTRQFCPHCTDVGTAGQCNKKTFLRIRRYSDTLKCQPEPTLTKLRLPGPEYSIEPAVVKVNRCAGYCKQGHGYTCVPTQTSFVKIPVILTHHGMLSSPPKCVEYDVEQHDICACDCAVKKEDCSSRHRHERCSCKCTNENEMIKCLETAPQNRMMWDEDKCECVCQSEACPYGLVWDSIDCRCELPYGDDSDNALI